MIFYVRFILILSICLSCKDLNNSCKYYKNKKLKHLNPHLRIPHFFKHKLKFEKAPKINKSSKPDTTITVCSKFLKIDMFDNGASVDKDIVSVSLNKIWLIKRQILRGPERRISFPNKYSSLKKYLLYKNRKNFLVMYAISEGKYKPCTSYFEIYDGKTMHNIELHAHKGEKAILEIKIDLKCLK